MEILLFLDVSPEIRFRALRPRPRDFARNFISSLFAFPFSGGAFTRTTSSPLRIPPKLFRDAEGITLQLITVCSASVMYHESMLFKPFVYITGIELECKTGRGIVFQVNRR